MILSDVSVKRPVFASVLALLLVIFGLVSYQQLPLREYPDIDPPVVAIETNYPGAAATVIETQITEPIEEAVAGIEGIEYIESRSRDGESDVVLRFSIGRDIEAAANDVRDAVSRVIEQLPEEADAPEIQRVDADADVIVWWNFASDRHTVAELTDYAQRYLVDRLSVLDGVARVRIGGERAYAMRVWLDRNALAARGLTVGDVESALRADNIELPAGRIESHTRLFTVRVQREFRDAQDFARLVVARGEDGHLVRLGEIARVERGTVDDRSLFRGNGDPMVGLGIIKQSTANTMDVARGVRDEVTRLNQTLPEGMSIQPSFDSSVFIEGAVREVYSTLAIATVLVVLIIFLFLGSLRAILVPAVAVPVSLVATFIALALFGFSVNLLTLLALVLAIGLVVDDGIIVLENIRRRMDDYGESALLASYRGARQVAFAVVSTTLVLISVFVPISFLQGDIGRLFSEFALTMAAAVAFSSFVALTVSPMLASKLLRPRDEGRRIVQAVDRVVNALRRRYASALRAMLRHRALALAGFVLLAGGLGVLFTQLESEYAPSEDRGAFYVRVNGPEGATHALMATYMGEVERRLMPYVDSGEVQRLLVISPLGGNDAPVYNIGMAIVVLADWSARRPADEIMSEVRGALSDLTGIRASVFMRQGFSQSNRTPVQFVIGGAGSYEELAQWRDTLLARLEADNPGLIDVDWDYKETQPQLEVKIDYDRAAALGVNVDTIGRTLETMLGSRRITNYIEGGREYDVIVEGERERQRSPDALENLYVRSDRSGELIPLSNLVQLEDFADSRSLSRYNRVRAITISAGLDEGLTLGAALEHLEGLAREHLPENVVIDYKGQSLDYQTAGGSIVFIFALGLLVVFLVLAAQFESWVHPFVIILGVPFAVGGGLFGLWVTGATLNLYSQIGLVMLIGLAAKNGILIVEFANQLRDEGREFHDAVVEASVIRLRPVLMTGITTVAGAIPLILAAGAGAETREVIGIVVFFGVAVSTVLTLFVIPLFYELLARNTGSPDDIKHRLEAEMARQ
ncbi:efflux RND transporter permease subunit [Pseudazoarcus pumilus]|uniref:Multidrug transporter AcrB n=1 Tax=Pseudazoarcus pumilus TaxID=2067960 RepID=A0A2I6SAE0_9RHOO|nr:efflux RND transporter permease subunit [Pseudazoarcus pumilus]AUN96205.1 multidrug transporter AcrB [Pseudazoarcus pumilus]